VPGKKMFNRRDYLKSVAGTASIGFVSTANAVKTGDSFDEVYKKALKIRNKTGNQKLFLTYLKRHNAKTHIEENKVSVQKTNRGHLFKNTMKPIWR
jgi:hypothetical protein